MSKLLERKKYLEDKLSQWDKEVVILAEAKQKLEAMGSKYLTSYPIRLALDIITNTNAPKLKMELKKIEKELDNEL